jgi:hypothetical protein
MVYCVHIVIFKHSRRRSGVGLSRIRRAIRSPTLEVGLRLPIDRFQPYKLVAGQVWSSDDRLLALFLVIFHLLLGLVRGRLMASHLKC